MRDITEKKRMDEELQKASKIESIGILAGGIAHDFNNILTAILGNISLAKLPISPEEKTFKRLSEAENACIRAKDLTQQLLTFSKGGAPSKKLVSISKLVNDSVTFAIRGTNVSTNFIIPEKIWDIEADEGQISQVLFNLTINAAQAMQNGGELSIKLENVEIAKDSLLPLKTGDYIKIVLKDNGIGIPEEFISKIFDPYFSTKTNGSGLGLATSYSIIKKHEGYISVDSKPGEGTTFTIYLQASNQKIEEINIQNDEKPSIETGKILVMDDEQIVREVIGEMLVSLGYDVSFSKEGKEAIKLYKEAMNSGEKYDFVIIDLTIQGGMGGKETILKLKELDPDIYAIVSSGYSNSTIISEYSNYGFKECIKKPYNTLELANTLAKLKKQKLYKN